MIIKLLFVSCILSLSVLQKLINSPAQLKALNLSDMTSENPLPSLVSRFLSPVSRFLSPVSRAGHARIIHGNA